VQTLGVDGTAFLGATATPGTTFATGPVPLNGRPRLLDVVEGRSGAALRDWFRPGPGLAGPIQRGRLGAAIATSDGDDHRRGGCDCRWRRW
jgi:hypothetical protein